MEESIFEWMEQVRLVDRVLFAAALAGPLGVAGAVALLRRRPLVSRFRDRWVLGALAGPAVFVLWIVYNTIVDRWGLDSVYGLFVNAAVFAAAALAGVALKLWLEKRLRPELAGAAGLSEVEQEPEVPSESRDDGDPDSTTRL